MAESSDKELPDAAHVSNLPGKEDADLAQDGEKLRRVLQVYGGGGDADIRAELMLPGSEASTIAEAIYRVANKKIDEEWLRGLPDSAGHLEVVDHAAGSDSRSDTATPNDGA